MECGRVDGGSKMNFMLQNDNKLAYSTEVLEPIWISNPRSSSFNGDSYSCSTSMGTSEDNRVENQTNMNTFPTVAKEENGIDDCDGGFYQPEMKKQRLTSDQVHCLERSFEVENKLEPERRVQLAREIGLQPRQVAIWFQNRRARFKTKQLEKDYGVLKASYDRLKSDYDNLLKEKERLKNEVQMLTEKLIHKGKESTNSESTQPNNPSVAEFQKFPISESKIKSRDLLMICKQEDDGSAKSDVLYSEQSDGEDELFAKSLFLTQLYFPKLEDACFDDPTEEGYNGNWSFSTDSQSSLSWLS